MIIREYRCQDCDYLFDDLMIKCTKEQTCPVCGSQRLNIISKKSISTEHRVQLAS